MAEKTSKKSSNPKTDYCPFWGESHIDADYVWRDGRLICSGCGRERGPVVQQYKNDSYEG